MIRQSIVWMVSLIGCLQVYCEAVQWSDPAAITTLSTNETSVFTCYDAENEQFIAIWQDATTHQPYYSLYSAQIGVWGPPALISAVDVYFTSQMYLSRQAVNEQIMALLTN